MSELKPCPFEEKMIEELAHLQEIASHDKMITGFGCDIAATVNRIRQALVDHERVLFDEIKICPICGKKVLWGSMVWLNDEVRCPECHEIEWKKVTK